MGCPSRLRGHGCSIDREINHEIHVAISGENGSVLARWRMVPEELESTDTPNNRKKETVDAH